MIGGWAGAMGQNQFMPSSFLRYAVDFDGDGRKNIWSSNQDVWASIANYLKKNGWRRNETWGTAVVLPEKFARDAARFKLEKTPGGCGALRSLSRELNLADWRSLGISQQNGEDLPEAGTQAALILEPEDARTSYLVYPNYRVILKYNCAHKYAVSVGLMSDMIQ
jgi:membrane-bound lytic murein transglycosylase B